MFRFLKTRNTDIANAPSPIRENGIKQKKDDHDTELGQLEASFISFADALKKAGTERTFLKDPQATETLTPWGFGGETQKLAADNIKPGAARRKQTMSFEECIGLR